MMHSTAFLLISALSNNLNNPSSIPTYRKVPEYLNTVRCSLDGSSLSVSFDCKAPLHRLNMWTDDEADQDVIVEGTYSPNSLSSFVKRTSWHHLLFATAVVSTGLAASAIGAPAVAADKVRDTDFNQRWPYRCPSDFLSYVEQNSKLGNWDSVVNAIDQFADHYPMFKLTPAKASILSNDINKFQPQNILEIGTFFGYSALHIAKNMPETSVLTTIEGSKENMLVATAILRRAFAGREVLNRIQLVNGISNQVLMHFAVDASLAKERKQQRGSGSSDTRGQILFSFAASNKQQKSTLLDQLASECMALDDVVDINEVAPDVFLNSHGVFDYVFLDHDKACYLPDLLYLEQHDLLQNSRCGLIADNVVYPDLLLDFLVHINARDIDEKITDTMKVSKSDRASKSTIQQLNKMSEIKFGTESGKGLNNTSDSNNAGGRWVSRLEAVPFERIGFETKFNQVPDAMSVSYLLAPPLFYRRTAAP